jgi:hypothetical protein
MQVKVIEVQTSYAVVEYEDHLGLIQRRMVPQGLMSLFTRGPATVPDEFIGASMDYSNVDLVATLGDVIPAIQVRGLQDQLRRAGLWTQKDYLDKADVVNGVWQRLRGVDTSRILTAAHQHLA